MKQRTWHIGLVTLILATGVVVSPALAEVTRLDVRVDGLTCHI